MVITKYLKGEHVSPKDIFKYARKLYFNEKFLRVAHLADPHSDSKNIVDMPTCQPLSLVLDSLKKLDETNEHDLKKFIKENFYHPTFDIITYYSIDWTDSPKFISKLNSSELREFAKFLNSVWNYLYRKFDYSNYNIPFVSSHIAMKHPFIVPGGRFREMYYWDTYWIIKGLLVCDMYKSVKMMIQNFIDFIDNFGFIPNGSRIYLLNRSQPPYFSKMIWDFYEYLMSDSICEIMHINERDQMIDFILNTALEYVIKEYKFWMTYRVVNFEKNGKNYKLNIYGANNYTKPRIESYYEDIQLAKDVTNKDERDKLFLNIIAAAESGYDFSSRWFEDPSNMKSIQTTNIVPVDLNSLLYETELIISRLARIKGDIEMSKLFLSYSIDRNYLMNELLWSDKYLCWFDYNGTKRELNENYYLSNYSPLWSNMRPPDHYSINDIINHHRDKLLSCEFGLPVSFIRSGQQWDYPNIWAPLQHQMVLFLYKYDYELALEIAKRYFKTVYTGWKEHGMIYEKYLATKLGERGIGGEYKVQFGFGWTNGAILDFMRLFKDELIFSQES